MLNYFPLIESIILAYFISLNGTYLLLNIMSLASISRYMRSQDLEGQPRLYADYTTPVSILVPTFNAEHHILTTIQSLLDLDYPNFEIIIINDGSTDSTLEVIRQAYSLVPFPEAYRVRVPSKPVHNIYRSTSHPFIRVIDKENGYRGDAVNAGINAAKYPLFCCVDSDSLLQKNSVRLIAEPFFEDPTVVACGGTIRVSNACLWEDGKLKVRLSKNPWVLFQVIEYLRSFLFGRMGWEPMNALLIVSGAFGMFHKETVISVGGYRTDTLGEDMELVMRLHRKLYQQGKPHRITFVPNPICWTEVPFTFRHLARQRIRWHIGHIESLTANIGLLFHPRGRVAGWVAFPFSLIFEWFGPIIEFLGYVIMITSYMMGILSLDTFLTFMAAAIGLGVLLSVLALFLEEIFFHLYPKPQQMLALFGIAVLENFGYRQLNTVWRVIAVFYYLRSLMTGIREIERR